GRRRRARRVCDVLHLPDAARQTRRSAGRYALMLQYLGLPVQASTHAAELDQMTVLVHWLMLIMFVGWGIFFVFVLFRFRRSANPTASYVGAKGKISKGTEVAVEI